MLKKFFTTVARRFSTPKPSSGNECEQKQVSPEQVFPEQVVLEVQEEMVQLRLLAEQSAWLKLEDVGRELLSKNPDQDEAIALVGFEVEQILDISGIGEIVEVHNCPQWP